MYIVLNKKQAFFRPATASYKRGYYFENQGLVFLKFMFLICGTLLYVACMRDVTELILQLLKISLVSQSTLAIHTVSK